MDKTTTVPRFFWPLLVSAVFLFSGRGAGLPVKALTIRGLAQALPGESAGWKSTGDLVFTSKEGIDQHIGSKYAMIRDFGCRGLLVRVYTDGQETMTLEAFLMPGGPEAYGAFSHFRDGTPSSIGQGGTFSPGMIFFWKGPVFFVLSDGRGAAGDGPTLLSLSSAISGAIKAQGPRPDLLTALPAPGLIRDSILYFRRQTSLDARYVLADENVLGLDGSADAVLADYAAGKEGHRMSLMIIRYRSGQAAAGALGSFSRDYFMDRYKKGMRRIIEPNDYDGFAGISVSGRFLFIVLDAPDRATCDSLLCDSTAAAARTLHT